jgi:hypothetical protein
VRRGRRGKGVKERLWCGIGVELEVVRGGSMILKIIEEFVDGGVREGMRFMERIGGVFFVHGGCSFKGGSV